MGSGMTEGLDGLAPTRAAAIIAPGERGVMDVFGVEVSAVLTGEQTGGAYSMYTIDCPPGAGAPPHVHSLEDEAFHVLSGEIAVWVNGEERVAGPGSTVFLPKGAPHAFRNPGSGRVRMLGVCTPAGHERFFTDASKLVPGPDGAPEDIAEAIAVCARHGIDLLPPPGATGQ